MIKFVKVYEKRDTDNQHKMAKNPEKIVEQVIRKATRQSIELSLRFSNK